MKSKSHIRLLFFAVLAMPSLSEARTDWVSLCAGHHDGWCGGDFWTREKLAGDMCGARTCFDQHGIVYDAQLTHFYQGVASGGQEQTFKFSGKLDQFVTFDFEKLGCCKPLKAVMHVETRFGETVISDAALLAPVNVNMLYPRLFENDTAITGFQLEYALDEQWSLIAGKINALDLIYSFYPQTGRGVEGFMNASIVVPLTTQQILPLSFLGAGVIKKHGSQIQGGVVVYDSHNSTMTSGFDHLFDDGANIAGVWRFFTNFGGLPGSHLFLGAWASGHFNILDLLGWEIVIEEGIDADDETGSWCLQYVLEQTLWVDPCNKNRNIGLLNAWGLADPETSPFGWIANMQLQAHGFVHGRERDSIGVGYFYSGLSGNCKRLLAPVLPVDDLQGVELYYKATITPWFHLTADLQIIEPAVVATDTVIVFALRANMHF